MVEAAQFELFVRYVTGNLTKSDLAGVKGVSRSTLARDLDWCWQVPTPSLVATGEIYDQIFLDGIYLNSNWVLLCGVNNRGETIAWQWATSENSLAYKALLKDTAPPLVVTTDGASGGLKAVHELWGVKTKPDPKHKDQGLIDAIQDPGDVEDKGQVPLLQRCLIHVHRNNKKDLTKNPGTEAGKALLVISKRLLKVKTKEEAAQWMEALNAFYQVYEDWIKERTYAKDDPEAAKTHGNKTWWYTHGRDRRVYQRLVRLTRSQTLFSFLQISPYGPKALSPFTNQAESANAITRRRLDQHRGMPTSHAQALTEWNLYIHSENPISPKTIYQEWNQNGRPQRRTVPTKTAPTPKPIGPAQYDTGLTADEGLWTRKGWAGRSLP